MPASNRPYFYLIIEGEIIFDSRLGKTNYTDGEYFISKIDTPKSARIVKKHLKALAIEFSVEDIISVILDIDGKIIQKNNTDKLLNNIYELLCASNNKDNFMIKHTKREIIFHLITGLFGREFVQKAINIKDLSKIYDINTWIKENFKTDFSVENLAEQLNMSISAFHQKFKLAVGIGPIQCQKKLRLLEARRIMLDSDSNVTDAALEVGYESVSQFIRDYKKSFGLTPKDDILKIKKYANSLYNQASK